MNLSINVSLVIVLVVFACMVVRGYKNGLIQEVISIIALGIAIVAMALIASAIGNYLNDQFGDMIIAIAFFAILMIAANLSKLIVVPVKFFSKLPIINWVNKIAGMCLGLAKGVACLWIIFILINMFEFFGVSQLFLKDIDRNAFLTFLYQNNYFTKIF